jgi:hypothetical protein
MVVDHSVLSNEKLACGCAIAIQQGGSGPRAQKSQILCEWKVIHSSVWFRKLTSGFHIVDGLWPGRGETLPSRCPKSMLMIVCLGSCSVVLTVELTVQVL